MDLLPLARRTLSEVVGEAMQNSDQVSGEWNDIGRNGNMAFLQSERSMQVKHVLGVVIVGVFVATRVANSSSRY